MTRRRLVIVMKHSDVRLCVPLLAVLAALASAFPAAQQTPLFTFHSNAWLNLHHYIRAVARGGPAPTRLTQDEQTQWAAGVEFYKPYVARDVLRDDGMVAIASALRGGEGRNTLDGIAIEPALKSMLERLMPIYRAHWWPQHDRANREWITAIVPLVDRHGAAISQSIARAYSVAWPTEPMHVDLSVVAGPVGAFAVNNHITISSSDASYRGYAGLEMVFHEASHGVGIVDVLIEPMNRVAAEQKVTLPPQLWHAVLFYTAGEMTTRELKARGIDYTPYANAAFYDNMCRPGCLAKIAEHWTPHLDGRRSIPDALAALVTSFR
jgi:hypothetical protein